MNDAISIIRANTPEVIAKFVDAWVADKDLNPYHAAEVIGHPGKAREFLLDRRCTAYYAAVQQELRITYADLRAQNIQLLGLIADYDPADAFDDRNEVRAMADIPANARAAIKKYKRKPDGSFEVEWYDRIRVIELLLNLFGDVVPRENAPGGLAQVHFHGRSK